jgi:uncharacterized 2Fe-2S/4Fe-4S cluster protein (DUF4445 family)
VKIISGSSSAGTATQNVLTREEIENGFRLACQDKITEEITVEIPRESLFETHQQILASSEETGVEVRPAVNKKFIALPPPTQEDASSDLERIKKVIAPFSFKQISLHTLKTLAIDLRKSNFCGTIVIADDRLIDFEAGDTSKSCYGVAFDIGTTTLVGSLIDLVNGDEKAIEARINPQTSYGDDVISRIKKCREDQRGLSLLQRVVISAVNEIIDALVAKSGIDRTCIYEVVFAGNTTMQQILCGIDPYALGELPFAPVFSDALTMRATELSLDINPSGRVYVFPQIGGFVGGDTVAGILASRLDKAEKPMLLVDIGTNGEIVLANNGKLIATSVAAGPAFEGARISCGMRAVAGAIEKIAIDGDVRINVIGNVRPSGICGSALIDLTAAFLNKGILEESGRFLEEDELPASLEQSLRKRIVRHNGKTDFILAFANESASGKPITVTQRDIRELQLATAAIRSGINMLLNMEGVAQEELEAILLAGAFGNFIRRNNARRIGLLPPIPCNRIRFIGNSSAMGAKMVLLSIMEKEYAAKIARKTLHVDLSLLPEFQLEFSSAMMFPSELPEECEK